MRFNRFRLGIALSVAAVAVTAAYFISTAEGSRQTAARYVKHEYRIPMRDGVKLFTQVCAPRDGSKTYSFLVERTPFGVQPYGEDQYRPQLGASSEFDRAGYIFVVQDVRGRFQSEGKFVDMRPHVDRSRSSFRFTPTTSSPGPLNRSSRPPKSAISLTMGPRTDTSSFLHTDRAPSGLPGSSAILCWTRTSGMIVLTTTGKYGTSRSTSAEGRKLGPLDFGSATNFSLASFSTT
jgi:hypothetical protein